MIHFSNIDELKSDFTLSTLRRDKVEEINYAFSLDAAKFINILDKEQQYYTNKKLKEFHVEILIVLEKLRKDKTTRQAVLRFPIDGDLPNCMLDIQFQIRKERIITTVYQRSLDMLTKVQQDIQIAINITEYFCDELSLSFEESKCVFFVGNAHYYDIDAKLEKLNHSIQHCIKCDLCNSITNKFDYRRGFGKLTGLKSNDCKKVDYVFVGINPSALREAEITKVFDVSEKHKNAGFVRILKELGIFNKSYITNIVKCSTHFNSDPTENQVKSCFTNNLTEEIAILRPKKVIALGKLVHEKIESFRNKKSDNYFFQLKQVYHPSYCFGYNKISYDQYKQIILEAIND